MVAASDVEEGSHELDGRSLACVNKMLQDETRRGAAQVGFRCRSGYHPVPTEPSYHVNASLPS